MDLLLNDCSVHGQFQDIYQFRLAIDYMIKIRMTAMKHGYEIYCHRNMTNVYVTPALSLFNAIQDFNIDEKRAIILWLNKHGPFWEDSRKHGEDDYLEYESRIVTDTAVGEAAFCCLLGLERRLISFAPSDWMIPVILVVQKSDTNDMKIDVLNYWDKVTIENVLMDLRDDIKSWEELKSISITRYSRLFFYQESFGPLQGHPFNASAAIRILCIFDVLNKLKGCFDDDGNRTPEGHEIYQKFFTGKKGDGGRGSLFSDSSDREKKTFKEKLKFTIPDADEKISCPWHGKVQTPPLRVHFSHPITAKDPLYVVYVGPKITKT